MIEDNKRLNTNESNSDNIIGKITNRSPRFKKDNDYDNNIKSNKIKTDIQILTEYNVDKTYMPSLELIKSNEENRNLNIPIYISFNIIFH